MEMTDTIDTIYVVDLVGRVWSIPSSTNNYMDPFRIRNRVLQFLVHHHPADFPHRNEMMLLDVEDVKQPDVLDEKCPLISYFIYHEPLSPCLRWDPEHLVFNSAFGCPRTERYAVYGSVDHYHYVTHSMSLTTLTRPTTWTMKVAIDSASNESVPTETCQQVFVGTTFLVNRLLSPIDSPMVNRHRFGWMMDQNDGYWFSQSGRVQPYPGCGRHDVMLIHFVYSPLPCNLTISVSMDQRVIVTETKSLWPDAPCHLHVVLSDTHTSVETHYCHSH